MSSAIATVRPECLAARSLDHVVVSVRDLGAAAESYRRLGFAVMPRAEHEKLGSANHIVQFHHNYLELLGDFHRYADPAMRDFMVSRFDGGDGLSLLALTSTDVAHDRQRLIEAGYLPSPVNDATRTVVLADGRADTTASAAVLTWRAAPRRWGSLFYCQHGKPHTIWYEPWQTHPNTVHALVGVTYSSDDFDADVPYLNHMLCAEPVERTAKRCLWHTPRGEWVQLMHPSALGAQFESMPAAAPFPVWPVALRFRVRQLQACRQALREGGVESTERPGLLCVAARNAAGVVLEFTSES